jgi:hypothetical protein
MKAMRATIRFRANRAGKCTWFSSFGLPSELMLMTLKSNFIDHHFLRQVAFLSHTHKVLQDDSIYPGNINAWVNRSETLQRQLVLKYEEQIRGPGRAV